MTSRLVGTRSSGSSSFSREITVSDLASLSFPTYLVVVRLLLARFGYEFVGNLGRWHLRSYKPFGGADFIVAYSSVQCPVRVLVQVKQETRNLQRRYVEELRNAMDRAGVSHGLIVTLGRASKPAREVADGQPGRPIHIVDGNAFAWYLSDELRFTGSDLENLQFLRFAGQLPNSSVTPRPLVGVSRSRTNSARPAPHDSVPARPRLLGWAVAFLLGVIAGVLIR